MTAIAVRPLVSRLRDYDGLVYAENWQVLRGDEQLNAARDTGLLLDKSDFLKCLKHLVDRWWCDFEVALKISFGWGTAIDL